MSSDFEGKSLDALYAMIASAKPGDLTKVGNLLEAAAPKIIKIAADLRVYFDKVQWKGEGGDAFRLWGADMVSETLRLSDFASTVGAEMQRSGQALSETQKSMPKPAGVCYADPEKEEARIKDETGPKLQEAIRLMERLSSYYKTAQGRMEAEPEPRFPMPPSPDYNDWQERPYATSGPGGGAASSYTGGGSYGGGGYYSAAAPSSPSAYEPALARQAPEHTVRPVAPAASLPETPVGTNLDSVAPPVAQEPGTRLVTQPVTPQAVAGGPEPGPLPTITPVTGQKPGGTAMSRPPSAPGVPAMARGVLPSGAGPVSGLPRVGGGDGIVGGKPMPGRAGVSPAGPRLPMGTVIGEERGAFGRGPMGMPGHGVGPHGTPGTGVGAGSGRRLATQPGGTVGAPAASGPIGRGTFTPGGTGLVRPPASTAPGKGERRQTTGRPDYLEEDEETWTMGQRKIVPPVID